MRSFFCVLLCLFLMACDSEEGPKGTTNLIKPRKPTVHELTLFNATKLKQGRYRLKPAGFWAKSPAGEDDVKVEKLEWGTVDWNGLFTDRVGAGKDAPKIRVQIEMKQQPYLYSKEGVPIFDFNSNTFQVFDEIVVYIFEEGLSKEVLDGGLRDDKFKFTAVTCVGNIMENLTHPDRKIEYE